MRARGQRLGIGLVLWAATAGLAGCGSSGNPVEPAPGNPYAAARVGTDTTLEIATWNLENFARRDERTVAEVILAVAAMDIDILALQEISSASEFQALVDGLGGWNGFKATSHRSINLAFLYKTDAFLGEPSFTEILGDMPPPDPLNRAPLVMSCAFRGNPLVVINNHYWAFGDGVIDEDDPEDRELLRYRASRVLDEYIRAHYAGERVVVVGDFNDELTTRPPNNVFQPFLDRPELYVFADMAIAEGPATGWSYPDYPSHLDHILITAPLFEAFGNRTTRVLVVGLDSLASAYFDLVSDHLPVAVKLELPPAGTGP